MPGLFYKIYLLIHRHRVISVSLFFLLLGSAGYISTKIRLEENITSVIPRDQQVIEVNEVMNGLKMNKQLVFHVYNTDTAEHDPDQLIHVAHALSDSLGKYYPNLIAEVVREVPDSRVQAMYDYYYSNLPFYLLATDYNDLQSRITPEGVERSLNRMYKQLLSPVGVATKMMVKDPLGLAAYPLQRMRDQQLDSNFDLYQNHIVTSDFKHLIFFVTLANPPNETANNGRLIDGVNHWLHIFEEAYPATKIEYFGPAAVAVANANRIKADIYLTVSLALAGLFIFISFFYRNPGSFLIVVTPGVFGAIMGIAFLSLFRESVSVISLGVGSVLLGITIDYALHFFTHYKKERSVRTLFKDLTGPLLMSGVTTACAFLSLIYIRSSALQDLGIFAGISVLGAVFYTLICLPHIVIKTRRQPEKPSKKKNWVERGVQALAAYPFYKKAWALILLVALSMVCFFTWKKVSFESDMLKLNYMPAHLERYQEGINAISDLSANNIYVAFNGDDLDAALQANVILQEELERLKSQDSIYSFFTLNNIIPPPGLQRKRLEQWESFWEEYDRDSLIRKFKAVAGQYGFREGTFSAFEETLKKEYTTISDKEKILAVMGADLIINNTDGSVSVLSTISLSAENKPAVLQSLSELPGIIILDKGYLTNNLVEMLREDFEKLVNTSLVVVFLIILISYGRIELALIAFTPIVLSWFWVLGLMGWLGLSFNIVNIIICTFIFGLGIDYSIFVMRGLTQDYAHGIDNLLSYKKSIILSMVTTLTGIGVLAFAQHPALQSIAFLAIIGILSVVFITFTVEHLLYHLLALHRKRKGGIPFTITSLLLTIVAFLTFIMGCFILYPVRWICKIPWAPEEKRKHLFHYMIRFFCLGVIYLMGNVHKEIIDRHHINFNRPSVIISNHHSFIDILLLLMFHPKVVMVTNDWVYHSPLFGKSVQFANFIPAFKGLEEQFEEIEQLIRRGYSIVVYPEGTRSKTFRLGRFHKGAFYLAERFNLDIQPVVLHGTSLVMPKGDDFYLKKGTITAKFLPRIKHDDPAFGVGYRERTKNISKYFKTECRKLREQREEPDFFRDILMKNFIYKGPVLEWYIRIKYRLEKRYKLLHDLVPKKGRVVDLGCGYGLVSYAMAVSSEGRTVYGIDYDEEKIQIAQNCPAKPANISFAYADVLTADYGKADTFILSDVLHYLTRAEQEAVLDRVASNLNAGGMVIIRDGDSSKETKHGGTRLTELFSTKSGFNKTRNTLNYISSEFIGKFAQQNNFELEIIDNSKRTSNTLFVLRQKYNGKL